MEDKFIAPPNDPVEASKELKEKLKRDMQALIKAGGEEADTEDFRKALRNIEKQLKKKWENDE